MTQARRALLLFVLSATWSCAAHTDTDTDTDTETDTDTDTDIQCVTQSWADANPCMLGCPQGPCPELETTVCACDETSGVCLRDP